MRVFSYLGTPKQRVITLLLVIIAATSVGLTAPVHSDRWLNDVKYLSSDELKGRGDGTPELNQAADYIAEQFRKAGLEPLPGGFFEPFTAATGAELGKNHELTEAPRKAQAYKLKQDFIPLTFSGAAEKSGALALAGYGITATEYNYDDYNGLDVSGKIVLDRKST